MADWGTATVVLGGALIGAGGAVLGGWLQTRWTLDTQQWERRRDRQLEAYITLRNAVKTVDVASAVLVSLPKHALDPDAASPNRNRLVEQESWTRLIAAIEAGNHAITRLSLSPESDHQRLHRLFSEFGTLATRNVDLTDPDERAGNAQRLRECVAELARIIDADLARLERPRARRGRGSGVG